MKTFVALSVFCATFAFGAAAPSKSESVGIVFKTDVEIVASVQGIELSNADAVLPGTLVCLEPEGVEDSRHTWDIRYPITFEQWQEENGKLFLAMPNQDVGITLFIAPNDQGKGFRKIRTVIRCKKSEPQPKPEPDEGEEDQPPTPDPDEKEREPVRGVLIIQQKNDADPDANALQKSATWRDIQSTIDSKNAYWMDADQERAQPYLTAARRVGLPAVLLFNEAMELLEVVKLPKTEKEFKELFE